MPYYCQEHNTAFVLPDPTGWRQFRFHWNMDRTGVHKGQPLPSQDEVRVDEPPEGATVIKTVSEKTAKTRAKKEEPPPEELPGEEEETVTYRDTGEEVDEDAKRLVRLLIGMGYTEQQRHGILLPFSTYESIRGNSMNLYNLIYANSTPRQKGFIPLIIAEYQGGTVEEEVESAPFYVPAGFGGQQQPPYFHPLFGRQYPGAFNPINYGPPRATETRKEDPIVKRLLEEVTTMKDQLKEEREERERERQEREEERKQQALEARFATVDQQVSALGEQIGQLVEALKEKETEKAMVAASSQKDELSLQVKNLNETLQKEREDKMLTTLQTLQKDYDDTKLQISNWRKELTSGAGSTGRTVEDLAAIFGPDVLNKLESAGQTIATEMAELRKTMQTGPMALASGLKGPQGGDAAIKQAERIARQMNLENKLLSRAGQ